MNVEEPGWPASTGLTFPTAWYITNQDGALAFGLYPPPNVSTLGSGVVTLPYVARPSSLVSTTAVPFTDTGAASFFRKPINYDDLLGVQMEIILARPGQSQPAGAAEK